MDKMDTVSYMGETEFRNSKSQNEGNTNYINLSFLGDTLLFVYLVMNENIPKDLPQFHEI